MDFSILSKKELAELAKTCQKIPSSKNKTKLLQSLRNENIRRMRLCIKNEKTSFKIKFFSFKKEIKKNLYVFFRNIDFLWYSILLFIIKFIIKIERKSKNNIKNFLQKVRKRLIKLCISH